MPENALFPIARRAPQRVGHAHLSDQVTNLTIELWASHAGARLPPPVRASLRRCQRIRVSSLRTPIAFKIDGKPRYSQTKRSRSEFVRRTRLESLRTRMLICWRRTRFSASSLSRDLKASARTPAASATQPSAASLPDSMRPITQIQFSVMTRLLHAERRKYQRRNGSCDHLSESFQQP